MPWQISEFGQTWTTEQLTVAEAEALEEELGVSWLLLNPMVSIKHFRAITATFLARGMDPNTANEKVRALEIRDLDDHIRRVPDDRPDLFEDGDPKAEATQPTGGSSPAPAGSDGPLT